MQVSPELQSSLSVKRNVKSDIAAGNVQTGIDPSQLVGADTSTGSGGYKTNRGEAHLKSDDYEQTRSVYENTQVEDKLKNQQPNKHQLKKQQLKNQLANLVPCQKAGNQSNSACWP